VKNEDKSIQQSAGMPQHTLGREICRVTLRYDIPHTYRRRYLDDLSYLFIPRTFGDQHTHHAGIGNSGEHQTSSDKTR
jgi:hypothetical protein